MAYEHYEKLLKDTQKCYRSGLINNANLLNELQEVYRKAKAFDEIRSFITERLKEEKTTDEYDYGERFMCEEIKILLEDE
ncbi:hypothetical protein [Staphylococcus gallinarum]|uniref:hypothetical protein n=1 Tax=Staphylococcus gallinarum TaxID=1293 RepID=UPI000E68B819|nr:hypothetical protein [Staphylococcus gallinarum]RIL21568.1 hypothetical protein BUY97_12215 [Staphylococcus gallinarum]RIL23766.1 hypothetical protein BUY99_04175 [Staphylococcus gallinarum]RIL29806.1 hypothetical protein BUY95_03855 [Staphylococcus gallinarum]